MHTAEGDYLFRGRWLDDYLQTRSADIRGAVESIPRAEFEATGDDVLAARVLAEVRVEPLVLDRDNIVMEPEDVTLDAREVPDRMAHVFRDEDDEFTPLPATRYVIGIPFSGDERLWEMSPNTYGGVYARGSIGRERGTRVLNLVFVLPKDSSEELPKRLEEELALIEQNRERQRPAIEAFNYGLRTMIVTAVAGRRREFADHAGLAEKMGVRLQTKTVPAAIPPPGPRAAAARAGADGTRKRWDVFISYAGEDRDTVARPLAEALKAKGLYVWFDKFELSLGDRLRRKIDEGLANSRFGVVVLSDSFFRKHWPQLELDGLAQREEGGAKVILPVWSQIDRDGVALYSPTLADRVAERWSEGIDRVVAAIMQVVKPV